MRTEQEVFQDLAVLCGSPGYIHTLAFLVYKDEFVGYRTSLKSDDALKMYSWDRLIRNEFTTLIGLLVKAEIDFDIPCAEKMQTYVNDTYRLMEELHHTFFIGPVPDKFSNSAVGRPQLYT